MKQSLSVLLLCCTIAVCKAQSPQLIDSLWTKPASATAPYGLVVYSDKIFYTALDSLGVSSLYAWDPASSKELKIATANPGNYPDWANTGYVNGWQVLNNKLYYAGADAAPSIFNSHLMVYDGMSQPVSSPVQVPSKTYWRNGHVAIGNHLYYVGGDSTEVFSKPSIMHLFRFDGTNPPTKISRIDTTSGDAGPNHVINPQFIDYNGKVYFVKDSVGVGRELFSYDRTTNQVRLVADIAAGPKDADIQKFTVGGGKLWFAANDGTHGLELYSYNGAVVSRLTDHVPGQSHGIDTSYLSSLTYFKGGLIFSTRKTPKSSAVYRYDAVTSTITKILDPVTDTIAYGPARFTPAVNNLFFYLGTSKTGMELWRYDGKACFMTADLNPGAPSGVPFTTVHNMVYHNGFIYYPGINNFGTYHNFDLYRVRDTLAPSNVETLPTSVTATIAPNPSSRETNLLLSLSAARTLVLSVTDMSGHVVYSAAPKSYLPGSFQIKLPTSHLAPGQYFYYLRDEHFRQQAAGSFIKL